MWWVNMHTFVANFLRYAATENYWNWLIFSQVFAKVKRVTLFETQCISLGFGGNNLVYKTHSRNTLKLASDWAGWSTGYDEVLQCQSKVCGLCRTVGNPLKLTMDRQSTNNLWTNNTPNSSDQSTSFHGYAVQPHTSIQEISKLPSTDLT